MALSQTELSVGIYNTFKVVGIRELFETRFLGPQQLLLIGGGSEDHFSTQLGGLGVEQIKLAGGSVCDLSRRDFSIARDHRLYFGRNQVVADRSVDRSLPAWFDRRSGRPP